MVRARPYLLAETLFGYHMNGAAHNRYLFEHLDFYECVRKEYNFFIVINILDNVRLTSFRYHQAK